MKIDTGWVKAPRLRSPVIEALRKKFPKAQLDGIDGKRLEEALDGVDLRRAAGLAFDTAPSHGQVKGQLETIAGLLRELKYELDEQSDKPKGERYALAYALNRAREKAADLDGAAWKENEAAFARWHDEEQKRQESWGPTDKAETYRPSPRPGQLRTNHCESLETLLANVATAFRVFQEANADARKAEAKQPKPKHNSPRTSATNRIVADLERVHAAHIGSAIPRAPFIEWAMTSHFGEKPLSKAAIRKRKQRGSGLNQ